MVAWHTNYAKSSSHARESRYSAYMDAPMTGTKNAIDGHTIRFGRHAASTRWSTHESRNTPTGNTSSQKSDVNMTAFPIVSRELARIHQYEDPPDPESDPDCDDSKADRKRCGAVAVDVPQRTRRSTSRG